MFQYRRIPINLFVQTFMHILKFFHEAILQLEYNIYVL